MDSLKLIFTLSFLLLTSNLYGEKNTNLSNLNLTKEQKEWIKNNPTITVQNEQDWEPFNYNQNNIPSGHSIDYMKLLGSKIGLNIKFIQGYTWKQYLEMLKDKRLDVVVNIAKTPQREKFYSYTSEYHKVLSSLYIREDTLEKYKSLKDLEGKTISVVQGMVGESVLRNNYPKIKIYPVKTSLEAIKAVVYGKADGVVQVNTIGKKLIKKYNIQNIKPTFEVGDPKFNMHLHLATNNQNNILRDILQKGMSKITDKELEALKEKHFRDKEEKAINLTLEEIRWLQNNSILNIGVPNFQEPLIFKDKIEGIFPDFINLLSKKLNIKFNIVPIETKSKTLKPLNLDAMLMINNPNKQNSSKHLFTNEFLSFPMVIASLEKAPVFNGLNDTNLKRLAIPATSPLKDLVKKRFPDIELLEVEGCKDGLNSLLKNKANAYVCNPHVIAHSLRNMSISDIAITSITPYQLGFTLKVSNENKILHSILNKTIDSFANQEIQNIKKQWQELELQKVPDYTLYFQVIIVSLVVVLSILLWVSWWNRRLKEEILLKEIAQKNALEKERQLSTLLNNVPGMAYRTKNEPDWPMLEVNQAALKLTGYSREEFMNRTISFNDIIIQNDRNRIWEEIQDSINKDTGYYIEYKIQTKSGKIKSIWERGVPVYSEDGELLWLEGLIVDNTEVKKAQQKAKESEEFLSRIVKSLKSGLFIFNVQKGKNEYINPYYTKLTGWSFKELNSMTSEEFMNTIHPDDIHIVYEDIESLKNVKNYDTYNDIEFRIKSKENKWLNIRMTTCPFKYDENGNLLSVLGSFIDITELRNKEEMLIAQSRSAAMGDMISMIAHQWKQPLASLSMTANNMKIDYELETFNIEDIETYYNDIEVQVQHLANTIDDFRDFFKPNKTKQLVLVQDIINDTLKMINKSLENNNIKLIKKFEDVGEISIFSNELFHVLLNIINNAKEALVYREIKDRIILISAYKEEQNVLIEIEDNAGGIKKDIIDKIFEPYFTTKESINGTGIGLYMAKTIIEKHFKGTIEVKNTPIGAKFIIAIPK